MSCGNRFQCGLSKSSRFQFQPDKPSNPALHSENQKRLSDLLKAREDMDKAFSAPSNTQSQDKPIQQFTELEPTNTDYTPWKTPSADTFHKVNQK